MLRLLGVQESVVAPDVATLEVFTAEGAIVCLRHAGAGDGDEAAAIFVGGALGGLSGPGDGVFARVAPRTGGVRLHYRRPGELDDCLLDVLLVQHLLARRGASRTVLVGHSFGGAVAVGAGVVLGDDCAGVVALSTQVAGTERVAELRAPLLLIHGDRDTILPHQASELVHAGAPDPKELVIVPGEGHLYEGVADALADRVTGFVADALAGGPVAREPA